MRWEPHTFTDYFSDREELRLEPRVVKPPRVERLESYGISVRNIHGKMSVSSSPTHHSLRLHWNQHSDHYEITGLLEFFGDIILKTGQDKWSITWSGVEQGHSHPSFIATQRELDRERRLVALWSRHNPGLESIAKKHLTGCARTLMLLELGAVISDRADCAERFDGKDFLTHLVRCWPSMAAWIGALGCDPVSGRLLTPRQGALEAGLLRLPPPIL